MSKITKILVAAAVVGVVGVSALPISSYAVTDPVTVSVEISDGLTISDGSDGGTATTSYFHDYGAAGSKDNSTGPASNGTHGTVTIFSNLPNGYVLSLADTDTDTDLKNSTYGIPTQSGLPVAGTPGWAVAVSTTPGTAGSGTLGGWQAMPASTGTAISLHDDVGVSSATGDNYDYGFATAIDAATVGGTYTDTVQFTATAK